MVFSKLEIEKVKVCDCMAGSSEDTSNVFMRRISAKKHKKGDFKIQLEKDDVPPANTCDDHCGQREISINKVDGYKEEEIVLDYKKKLIIQKMYSPKIDFIYLKFKFEIGAGNVKSTPQHGHESHFDFYKSDDFSVEKIKPVEDAIVVSFTNEEYKEIVE